MSARRKARLTRRLQSQYNAIISGNQKACENIWWQPPGFQYPNQPPVNNPRFHYSFYRNEWGAYTFAKNWAGRQGVDMKRLQRIVIQSGNAECAWRYARDIPGANVRRLQAVVLEHGCVEQLRNFARFVHGADKQALENAAIVAEVMAM